MTYYNTTLVVVLAFLFCFPSPLFAHQPRLTESRLTPVSDPEISQVYYGKLTGEPDVYVIDITESFNLYVNVLVPDIDGQKKDVSAVILKDTSEKRDMASWSQVALLEGITHEWEKYYEPFGADTYWRGPEYQARVEAGRYEIRIWSSNNDSKYSLAIGEIEKFNGTEAIHAMTMIPALKRNFFETSSISFIKSPFGWMLILAMYLLAGIVGLIYRGILKKFAENSPRGSARNIGSKDRVLRLALGVGLLVWAITTTWNPILLFFSGFCFFESAFSWCGLYAALGKSTCPVNSII